MGFLDEVAEHGEALRRLVVFYQGDGDELLLDAGRLASRRPRSFTFTGMGSSEIAAGIARNYLCEKTVFPVVIWEAGELLHSGLGGIRDDDVVIAISQSGESVETRQVVDGLMFHRQVLSVTNNPESSIARWASVNLPILAGEEASISNKTYVNTMAVLLLLSRALAEDNWSPLFEEINKIAEGMDEQVKGVEGIEAAAELLSEADALHFVSRGSGMVAARQAALTFQEGAGIFACALPGGSMRHGPFEMVGEGHHAVMFAPDGELGNLVRNMACEMVSLGSKVVLFTTREVSKEPGLVCVMVPSGDVELFPLRCAVPQELLLSRIAANRGCSLDSFKRGGKITERE